MSELDKLHQLYKNRTQKIYEKQKIRYNLGLKKRDPNKVREYRYRVKDKLFDILGHKCVKCGFDDKRALQFDHKNGDGNIDRKKLGGCDASYRYYVKHPEEAKEKLQVMCANCNWIKRAENFEHRR